MLKNETTTFNHILDPGNYKTAKSKFNLRTPNKSSGFGLDQSNLSG